MFNYTKRESLRLPHFLTCHGLSFSLNKEDVLGFRNLVYGSFGTFKHVIMEFLSQFPIKECKVCVDDVVDFDVDVLGLHGNVIIILRLVLFMITLERISEALVEK